MEMLVERKMFFSLEHFVMMAAHYPWPALSSFRRRSVGPCPLVEFTLNLLGGSSLSSLTLRQSPMSVASEQCGMVGTMPTRTTSKDKDHAIRDTFE